MDSSLVCCLAVGTTPRKPSLLMELGREPQTGVRSVCLREWHGKGERKRDGERKRKKGGEETPFSLGLRAPGQAVAPLTPRLLHAQFSGVWVPGLLAFSPGTGLSREPGRVWVAAPLGICE